MDAWIIFWAIVIVFSILSFGYMSIQVLYKGFSELFDMFRRLDEEALEAANAASAEKGDK
jgi:hypothetical protein